MKGDVCLLLVTPPLVGSDMSLTNLTVSVNCCSPCLARRFLVPRPTGLMNIYYFLRPCKPVCVHSSLFSRFRKSKSKSKSMSKSELIYDRRFTAHHVFLDVNPLRPTTRAFFNWTLMSHPLWREDIFVSYEDAYPFVKCTYRTCSALLKHFPFAFYTSSIHSLGADPTVNTTYRGSSIVACATVAMVTRRLSTVA
jgi:hypothetical protein